MSSRFLVVTHTKPHNSQNPLGVTYIRQDALNVAPNRTPQQERLKCRKCIVSDGTYDSLECLVQGMVVGIVQGHQEIDLKAIKPPPKHVNDLDEGAIPVIQKMMFDQQQKRQGLPTSDELMYEVCPCCLPKHDTHPATRRLGLVR